MFDNKNGDKKNIRTLETQFRNRITNASEQKYLSDLMLHLSSLEQVQIWQLQKLNTRFT